MKIFFDLLFDPAKLLQIKSFFSLKKFFEKFQPVSNGTTPPNDSPKSTPWISPYFHPGNLVSKKIQKKLNIPSKYKSFPVKQLGNAYVSCLPSGKLRVVGFAPEKETKNTKYREICIGTEHSNKNEFANVASAHLVMPRIRTCYRSFIPRYGERIPCICCQFSNEVVNVLGTRILWPDQEDTLSFSSLEAEEGSIASYDSMESMQHYSPRVLFIDSDSASSRERAQMVVARIVPSPSQEMPEMLPPNPRGPSFQSPNGRHWTTSRVCRMERPCELTRYRPCPCCEEAGLPVVLPNVDLTWFPPDEWPESASGEGSTTTNTTAPAGSSSSEEANNSDDSDAVREIVLHPPRGRRHRANMASSSNGNPKPANPSDSPEPSSSEPPPVTSTTSNPAPLQPKPAHAAAEVTFSSAPIAEPTMKSPPPPNVHETTSGPSRIPATTFTTPIGSFFALQRRFILEES